MTNITVDTSGRILRGKVGPHGFSRRPGFVRWPDLSPFAQGYVEAALLSVAHAWVDFYGNHSARFTDLAPETLAAMAQDCEMVLRALPDLRDDIGRGRGFWNERQAGHLESWPRLILDLGEDDKVYQQEAA